MTTYQISATDLAALVSQAASAAKDIAGVQAKLAAIKVAPAPTPAPVPVKPVVTNLAATAPAQGQLVATWTNPTPAPTSVTVARDGVEAGGGGLNWSDVVQGAPTSQPFNSLADGTAYTLTITPNGGTPVSVKATTLPAIAPTPVPTPTPTPTPSGPTLPFSLGLWSGDPSDPNLVNQFQSAVGQPVQVISTFGSRDNAGALVNPSYVMTPVTAMGKTVCISFEGDVSDGENSGESFRTLDRGVVQSRAAAFGANLVANGQANAIIRMRTEADNDSSTDEAVNAWVASDITAYASFVQAMYTGLKSVKGQNFTCLADVAFDPGNNTNKIAILQSVLKCSDGFGLDIYNTSVPWGSAWTTEADQWDRRWNGYAPNSGIGYKAYLDFAAANNKPIGIPEMGPGAEFDNNGAQQAPIDGNATFYTSLFNALMAHPVKKLFVCAWEAPGEGILINTPQARPASAAAFKASFGSKPGASWPHS